jgi:hypothetical protein
MMESGSISSPSRHTPQCRCGPVVIPVTPTLPMRSPPWTVSPALRVAGTFGDRDGRTSTQGPRASCAQLCAECRPPRRGSIVLGSGRWGHYVCGSRPPFADRYPAKTRWPRRSWWYLIRYAARQLSGPTTTDRWLARASSTRSATTAPFAGARQPGIANSRARSHRRTRRSGWSLTSLALASP